MKIYKSIFILILFYSSVQAGVFDDHQYITDIQDYREISDIKKSSDSLALVFYYSNPNSYKTEEAITQIEQFADDYLAVVKVYSADCDKLGEQVDEVYDEIKECDPEQKKKLPQAVFYQPPYRRVNPYTGDVLNATEDAVLQFTKKTLSSKADKMIPFYRSQIANQKELDEFLQFKKLPNKLILFHSKKEAGLLFRGLSGMFRDRIDFGEVQKSSADIVSKYGIKEFPSLLLLKYDERLRTYETEIYKGEKNGKEISKFLRDYALDEKINREEDEFKSHFQQKRQKTKEEEEEELRNMFVQTHVFIPRKFQTTILQDEKAVLLHVYQDGNRAEIFDKIKNKFGEILEYYDLSLSNEAYERFAKNTLKVKKYPSLVYFNAGTSKKEKSKQVFDAEIALETFIEEVQDVFEDKSQGLNEMNLQNFVGAAFMEGKTPIIMFYDKQLSLSYQTFTHISKYTEKIKFFSFPNPSQQLREQWQIKRLPYMVSIFLSPDPEQQKKGQTQIASYTGRLAFKDMRMFFDQIVGRSQETFNLIDTKLVEIYNNDDFIKNCVKRTTICFIGFLNGKTKQTEEFEQKLDILNNLKKKFANQPINFLYIDGLCHSYLLEQMSISDDLLPQLIAYSPKKNSFINQVGTFQQASLEQYVQKVINGQYSDNPLRYDLEIKEQECFTVYEERERKLREQQERSNEDDEILREILEEQRLKREQQEKEDNESNKKNKKKKKNNKKEDL